MDGRDSCFSQENHGSSNSYAFVSGKPAQTCVWSLKVWWNHGKVLQGSPFVYVRPVLEKLLCVARTSAPVENVGYKMKYEFVYSFFVVSQLFLFNKWMLSR